MFCSFLFSGIFLFFGCLGGLWKFESYVKVLIFDILELAVIFPHFDRAKRMISEAVRSEKENDQ